MNIGIQCCAVALMVVLLYFYYSQKKLFLSTEKAFLSIYFATLICLFFDIFSIFGITYRNVIPAFVPILICKMYLVSIIIMLLCCLLYVCTDICNVDQLHKVRKIGLVVSIIFTVAVLVLPLSIEDSVKQNVYVYGPSVLVTYGVVIVTMITILISTQRYKVHINRKRRKAVQVWMLIGSLAVGIQFFHNELLVVGYACALGILVIFLSLENPAINIDRQTGLFTQNAFLAISNEYISKKQPFSVVYMSCRQRIQDTYHMDAAEEVHLEVAEFANNLPDVFAFGNVNNELLLLVKNPKDSEALFALIRERFSRGWGTRRNVYLSMGGLFLEKAEQLQRAEDIIQLFNYIRQNNKELDGQDIVPIPESVTWEIYEEKRIEQLLVEAIEENRVEVFYQPIYSTKEKRFVTAEALVRIRDKEGNLVSPGVFIGIAEQKGLIIGLGARVFENVCRFIKEVQPKKYGIDYIEVNLSVIQCAYEYLAESFIEIMERYDVRPEYINLEITESASIESKKILLRNMNKLLDYGVKFSLDDFGTGQSNLNYIAEMPVSFVKFDRSMICSYFESLKSKYIMDAAMQMIHGMKLHIISEGIETEEQFKVMEQLGISYIQGYYFSKPLEEEEFLTFIKEKHKRNITS